MHPIIEQSPAVQMSFGAHVSPAAQSSGFPQ
jgi:hypothetical protein